ncbi:MAG TPA: ABC transporter permease [Actinomycetales bacterium]|nr:ABC transporter permease [Actinomycetales bacterium]
MRARLQADRSLLTACAVLVLVGAAVLAGLVTAVFDTATTAARDRLEQLPTDQRLLTVSGRSTEDGVTAAQLDRPGSLPADAAVLDDLDRTLGAARVRYSVHTSASTDLIRLTGEGSQSDAGPLRVIAIAYDDLPAHAELVAGEWPTTTPDDPAGTIPVAIHAAAAQALGVAVGDTRTGELDGGTAAFRVVGTWVPCHADDPYFAGDPLEVKGSRGATTFGPVVPADPAVLGRVGLRWRVVPDIGALQAADLPGLERSVGSLTSAIREDPRLTNPDISAPLAPHVQDLARQSVATSSVSLVPVALIAVLLGAALLLTAGLLADRRAGQTRLVRARGASAVQVARGMALEALVLAVPGVLLAAPAALFVLSQVSAQRGSALGGAPSTLTWGVGVLASVVGAVLVLTPSLLAARRWSVVSSAPGRRRAAARSGLELALLLGAAVAIWQLRRYSGAATESAGGGLATDPVLVAAPALAVLAGAVLAARLVPLAARVWVRLTGRQRGVTGAMAACDVARRPGAHAPVVLLLCLAVGAGMLAVGYRATWDDAQDRTAEAQVGADVQVALPDTTVLPSAAAAVRAGAFDAVPGTSSVTPLVEEGTSVGGTDAVLLATGQPDQGAGPGVQLPADTTDVRLRIRVGMTVGAIEEEMAKALRWTPSWLERTSAVVSSTVWLATRDGEAVAFPLPAGEVRPGSPSQITAELQVPAAAGGWSLIGLDAAFDAGAFTIPAKVTFTAAVGELSTKSADEQWKEVDTPASWPGSGAPVWHAAPADPARASSQTVDWDLPQSPKGLPAAAATLPIYGGGAVGTRLLAGTARTEAIPAVVSPLLAKTVSLQPGAQFTAAYQGRQIRVTAERVAALPGSTGPALQIGLGDLAAQQLESGQTPPTASRWRVMLDPDVRDDDARRGRVLEQLAAAGATVAKPNGTGQPDVRDVVLDKASVARQLAATPPANSVPGQLRAGAVVALLVAAVGLATALVLAAGRRRVEWAVLRVLGLSRRQVDGMAALETSTVGALALVAGAVVGWAACVLTVPSLVTGVSAAGVTAESAVVPVVPTLVVLGAAAAVLALLLVIRALLARRRPRATDVRLGEDP